MSALVSFHGHAFFREASQCPLFSSPKPYIFFMLHLSLYQPARLKYIHAQFSCRLRHPSFFRPARVAHRLNLQRLILATAQFAKSAAQKKNGKHEPCGSRWH